MREVDERAKSSQLVGDRLDVGPNLGSVGLAVNLDVELHGCRRRKEVSYGAKARTPNRAKEAHRSAQRLQGRRR